MPYFLSTNECAPMSQNDTCTAHARVVEVHSNKDFINTRNSEKGRLQKPQDRGWKGSDSLQFDCRYKGVFFGNLGLCGGLIIVRAIMLVRIPMAATEKFATTAIKSHDAEFLPAYPTTGHAGRSLLFWFLNGLGSFQ